MQIDYKKTELFETEEYTQKNLEVYNFFESGEKPFECKMCNCRIQSKNQFN